MKLVVLTDLNPTKFPGAASIAHALAKEANQEFNVEFWFSDIKENESFQVEGVPTRIRRISKNRARKMEGNLLQRIYFEILGFKEFYWIFRQLRDFRPTHLWIHQIGSRFPKSIIPILKLLNISVVITIHDFSIIFNRKLFPADLSFSKNEIMPNLGENMQREFRLSPQVGEHRILLTIRRKIILLYFSCATRIVCISEMQASILNKIGLRIDEVLPNGTRNCDCIFESMPDNSKFHVLFAGRPNAKGLEFLLKSINDNPDIHLHLAGSYRLVELARQELSNENFTYHGLLNGDQIANLMHRVQLVSVLSQCFDVYPTITIEALSHKIPVITTNLTGNSHMVNELSGLFVVNHGEIPDLKQIQEVINNSTLIFPRITSVNESWKSYKAIFSQTY